MSPGMWRPRCVCARMSHAVQPWLAIEIQCGDSKPASCGCLQLPLSLLGNGPPRSQHRSRRWIRVGVRVCSSLLGLLCAVGVLHYVMGLLSPRLHWLIARVRVPAGAVAAYSALRAHAVQDSGVFRGVPGPEHPRSIVLDIGPWGAYCGCPCPCRTFGA